DAFASALTMLWSTSSVPANGSVRSRTPGALACACQVKGWDAPPWMSTVSGGGCSVAGGPETIAGPALTASADIPPGFETVTVTGIDFDPASAAELLRHRRCEPVAVEQHRGIAAGVGRGWVHRGRCGRRRRGGDARAGGREEQGASASQGAPPRRATLSAADRRGSTGRGS